MIETDAFAQQGIHPWSANAINLIVNQDLTIIDCVNALAVCLATTAAVVSALCASRSNVDVQAQSRGERFDTLYGNRFHQSLQAAYDIVDEISSCILVQTLTPSAIQKVANAAGKLPELKMRRQALRLDLDFSTNGTVEAQYEVLDDAVCAAKSFVSNKANDWNVRANTQIEHAEKAIRSLELIVADIREGYKMPRKNRQ